MTPHQVQVVGPGTELGPYRFVSELGRGGMGVVYRALDRRLGREVAIKTISGLADQEAVDRFVREARAAARLRHPGVVQVLDAGSLGGVAFVALELVAGGSLQKKLEKGPLPPHEAAALVRDLALAVQAAHDAGILHRDLKPANVLLEADGRPRLTDFGLARDEQGASLTETGVVLGTPAYMSPEQANADKAAMGPATDVYGLGAILYHALTGTPPFQGGTGLAVMHRVLTEDVESPTRRRVARGLAPVARDLETICLKALEKRPGARYSSALALSEELGRLLTGEPIAARPPGAFERGRRAVRRNRAVAATVLVGVAAASGIAGIVAVRERAARAEKLVAARTSLEAAELSYAQARARRVPRSRDTGEDLRRHLLVEGARALYLAQVYDRLEAADARGRLVKIARSLFEDAVRFDELSLAQLRVPLCEPPAAAQAVVDAWASPGYRERRGRAERAFDEALMHFRLGRYAQSVTCVRRAVDLAPDLADARGLLAQSLWKKRDLAEALEAFDRAIELDPQNPLLLIARAGVKLDSNRVVEAEVDLTDVLRAFPGMVNALAARGEARLRMRDFGGALEDARALIEVAPGDVDGHVLLGQVLDLLGRDEEALAEFEKVLAIEPSPQAHAELAVLLLKLSRVADARRELARALELEPNFPQARALLEQIDAGRTQPPK